MQFLKVSHQIFDLGLSPNELKIYLFLVKCQNCLATATVRVSTICEQCAISSATTVREALRRLELRSLIQRKHRHSLNGLCISTQYTIRQLGGKWFRLWLGVRPFTMDKSAFAVYLYLCQQRIAYSGKACPSQNRIAAAVGLARHTVHEAVKRLAALGALIKADFWKGRHNLYTVLQEYLQKDIKKGTSLNSFARTNEGDSQRSESTYNIVRFLVFVKTFFVKLGCAIFGEQYLDRTINPKEEKIRTIPYSCSNNKRRRFRSWHREKCALLRRWRI